MAEMAVLGSLFIAGYIAVRLAEDEDEDASAAAVAAAQRSASCAPLVVALHYAEDLVDAPRPLEELAPHRAVEVDKALVEPARWVRGAPPSQDVATEIRLGREDESISVSKALNRTEQR